jgi:hypothetical protein
MDSSTINIISVLSILPCVCNNIVDIQPNICYRTHTNIIQHLISLLYICRNVLNIQNIIQGALHVKEAL